MRISSTIRSILAVGILLVFAFSIIPKVYLHGVFADHHDIELKVVKTGNDQVGAGGFLCDINDQVATSPFTGEFQYLQIQPAPLFPTATTQHLLSNVRMQIIVQCDLRGPPSLI